MAKITNKREEVTGVTLTLTKDEARALRALTGRCSPRVVGNIYQHTTAVWQALRNAGIDAAPVGERFRIVASTYAISNQTKTARGENCEFGDPGCDCSVISALGSITTKE